MPKLSTYEPDSPTVAALNGLGMPVRHASGSIASPIPALDIALPVGPKLFKLYLHGIDMSGGGYMCGAVSVDGGGTFVCDTANYEVYCLNNWQSENSGSTVTRHGVFNDDSVMVINFATGLIVDWEIDIFPGDDNNYFRMLCKGMGIGAGVVTPLLGAHAFNPGAAVVPAKSRINAVRFADYGSGDLNTPSGANLLAGSWTLTAIA